MKMERMLWFVPSVIKTKKIYLGHLSKENNIKELAHMTMENQLARADFGVGTDFKVYDTSPDTATPLTDI